MTDLTSFADAFHSAGLSISLRNRYNNFGAGLNPWINMQAPPGKNLLASMIEASVALSASASQAIVANADLMDEWFQQLEVSPFAATPARIFLKTRKGAEELERLVFDTAQGWTSSDIASLSSHIGSYQRSAPATFTASGTRTDTSEYWFPIGGPAASVRLTIPAITGAYAASVTVSSYTLGWFEVYSIYTGTVAAFENQTATLASGNNQDMMALNVFPQGIACDVVSIVSQTTTNVTAIYMTDATGAYVINMDDAQSINATQYVYPRFATNSPVYGGTSGNVLVFQLYKTVPTSFRISLANSTSLDFLWIQVQGPDVAPGNSPAQTGTAPAVNQTGTPQPNVGPTGSSSSGGGRGQTSYAGPAPAQSGGGGAGANIRRLLGGH